MAQEVTAKKKTPNDDQITEEDMREVGRVAFGILYPGDLDRPRKKPSPVTWDVSPSTDHIP